MADPSEPERVFWTSGVDPIPDSNVDAGDRFDTVVVGAGYAGLSAAIELVRAGQRVLVVDAVPIGSGASSRAAGSLANLPKARLGDLTHRYDSETASRVYREFAQARAFTEAAIATHGVDCDLQRSNRVLGAHSQRAFSRLARELPAVQAQLKDARLLGPEELRDFVGASAYHGGMLVPDCATVNPAKYQFGLARRAQALGGRILQRRRMTGLVQRDGGCEVHVEGMGTVGCSHVLLATNAETGREAALSRTLSQRMARVPSFVVVTAPERPNRIRQVLNGARIFGDTSKVLNYLALTPCGTRLVYSARAGFTEGSTLQKAQKIAADYRRLFPATEGLKIDYYWSGRFAITDDLVPHTGQDGRVHWAVGCCGAGITMSSYLGFKSARRILGDVASKTVFELPLPRMAGWRRNPALLGAAIKAYRLYDRVMN
jgi:glycine/D-amino acid oxidase-like deaminating enzyme